MLMKYIKTLIMILFVLLLLACSINTNSNAHKNVPSFLPESNEHDSIFLLSITDVDDSDQVYMFSYYLDTLNCRLSFVGFRNQEVTSYRCYTINPKESIEYDDNMEGHVKLILRKGLIVEKRFTDNNVSIKLEYDSLRHLKSIVYVGGMKILLWEGNHLQQVSYLDSTSSRFNQIQNIQYECPRDSKGYSLELLNSIVTDTREEFLFAYLGLYGLLPMGNDYIVEKITYDYRGIDNRKYFVYNEDYSNDTILIKSHIYPRGNSKGQKKSYLWNLPNIDYLIKMF